jgi:hypothetical protein
LFILRGPLTNQGSKTRNNYQAKGEEDMEGVALAIHEAEEDTVRYALPITASEKFWKRLANEYGRQVKFLLRAAMEAGCSDSMLRLAGGSRDERREH